MIVIYETHPPLVRQIRFGRRTSSQSYPGNVRAHCPFNYGGNDTVARNLAPRGKNPNIAVVAVARELSGFIWDISQLAMSLAIPREACAV